MTKKIDVVVVGSGIGGLVAGCYLVKNGLRTIIVERHDKVGGYCGSFSKDGHTFDEAVHYINHMSKGGILRKICEDLDIMKDFELITVDPSDILFMPGLRIAIYHNISRTIDEMASIFPDERLGLQKFFDLIANFNFFSLYSKYSRSTFQDILNEFFKSNKLKTCLGMFSLILGLTPKELSGLAALAYYRGSILDGGHHPRGGAQKFSDTLAGFFKKHGGEIILKKSVEKILVENNTAVGVVLDNGLIINSSYVLANCDVTTLYTNLIEKEFVSDQFLTQLNSMHTSTSNFLVYLGLNKSIRSSLPMCSNLWYFPYESFAGADVDITKDDRKDGFVHIALSSAHDPTLAPSPGETIILFSGASFQNKDYWAANKERLMDILIARAEKVIPNLSSLIRIKFSATPQTLHRYTLNRNGAYRGWEITSKQNNNFSLVGQRSFINNLFLAGHWVTTPVGNGGVSMVADMGKIAAKSILRSINQVEA